MAKNAYIGVGGVARKVKAPYIGVGGVAKKVKSGYIGVGGVARQFYQSGIPIGSLPVGSSVYMNVSGVSTEFIVVHQGLPSSMYDESCNGTWLMMNIIYKDMNFNSTKNNSYVDSEIHAYLRDTLINQFDANIKAQIKTVKIPYITGKGNAGSLASGANGLSVKLFALSCNEVGGSGLNSYYAGDGAKLDYFPSGNGTDKNPIRAAKFANGNAGSWWTRSPFTNNANGTIAVRSTGAVTNETNSYSMYGGYGVRPALILPSSAVVNESNFVV